MAIVGTGIATDNWVRDAFLKEATDWKPQFVEWFSTSGPTEESIKRDVAKLKSLSAAGRAHIADQRMARASIGKYRDVFFFPRSDGRPLILLTKSRQQGITYAMTELKQKR